MTSLQGQRGQGQVAEGMAAKDKGVTVVGMLAHVDLAQYQPGEIAVDMLRGDQFVGQSGFLLEVVDDDLIERGKAILDPGRGKVGDGGEGARPETGQARDSWRRGRAPCLPNR